MLLLNEGSGALTARELVRRCAAASEQLSLVYALSSPDLFQAALFETWIGFLEQTGVLAEEASSKLLFEAPLLEELAGALGFVLPPRLRQTLVNLAGATSASRSVEPAAPNEELRR
jgi:glycerol-3-phosphate O-acyltransferase